MPALNRAGKIGPLQGLLVPAAGSSDHQAVGAVAIPFDTTMTATETFAFSCDTDCYIAQGAAPVAAADDGSMLVPAGFPVIVDGGQGAKLSVIRKAVDGVATLQKVAALQ